MEQRTSQENSVFYPEGTSAGGCLLIEILTVDCSILHEGRAKQGASVAATDSDTHLAASLPMTLNPFPCP